MTQVPDEIVREFFGEKRSAIPISWYFLFSYSPDHGLLEGS